MIYSCQATNLDGTGQQATPVTVRHTGRKKPLFYFISEQQHLELKGFLNLPIFDM